VADDLNSSGGDPLAIFRVRVVPCSEPWALITLNTYESNLGGSYPGDNEIAREIGERCDWATTFHVTPSRDSWASGDRLVTCFLTADGVFSPSAGDCFWETEEELYVRGAFRPCDKKHLAEIFYVGEVPDDDSYPGQQSLDAYAEQVCLDAFQSFVGVPYERSRLLAWWFAPTEAEWELLERRFLHCYLFQDGLELITGSLAGSRE